jgi:hypothetical protein
MMSNCKRSTIDLFKGALLALFSLGTAHSGSMNSSDLHVSEKKFNDFPTNHICSGSVPANVDLASIHLTPEDLKKGVSCLVGDFDGNGFIDFMLYGGRTAKENQHGLILFFKGASVLRTQVIDAVDLLAIFEESDKERANYPKYKGIPGLIWHAEGDGADVYFYDKKTSLFKKVPYVFPKNVDMGD